ncbi:MAG: peptidoglycan editing factor PgeF [Holosporaceae bacterium]|nr:peptidoglycan editing factor PgeF [Holosporaceae bacterium]
MRIKSAKIFSEFVEHGFFGRIGGKSFGVYASLNCSKSVGDEEAVVLQNLEIVRKELQVKKLITPNQTHSAVCVVVDNKTETDVKADALVTNTPGIAIGILTADCAPILFADAKKRIIGAAHAGWRGAAFGVVEATVQKMTGLGSDPKDITAAIGPCVAVESYEVDDDFKRDFKDKGDCFLTINGKLHFDLPKYCRDRLIQSGLSRDNIDSLGIDTYADQENYFSYRFARQNTNGICGRQISAICLKQ